MFWSSGGSFSGVDSGLFESFVFVLVALGTGVIIVSLSDESVSPG